MPRIARNRPGSGLISTLRNLTPFLGPFLSYRLRRIPSPVLAGYKITHKCNLKCRHCPYWKRTGTELGFDGLLATMTRLRDMGIKILILEGGEPLLWRDGSKTMEHVVEAARTLFPCVCMTTNGTLPWAHLELDRVWISLDGPPQVHDAIRGPGVFRRVWDNLETQSQGRALISTTINSGNVHAVPELITTLKGRVEGITIQFHYPYNGLPDPLFVPPRARAQVLDELIQLKQKGFPVANSVVSLTDLKRDRWTCEDRLLANAEPDGTLLHGCYLKNRGPSECANCGFSAHNEMSLAFRGKLESIRTGLGIFFPNTPARCIIMPQGRQHAG